MLQTSKASPPTLVNIALDLQITICTLLHPSDILALRETCKTLQLPTRQRVVWVAALHRACLNNSLFPPSFPIHDMSDVEVERAAMAPHRWIGLCAAFEKKHPYDSGAQLRPRTTRMIEHSLADSNYRQLFIVPGGRYMVNSSPNGIFIWDLGYTSSADCKLVASTGPEGGLPDGYYSCVVQATPDGMGLIIFSSHAAAACSVYEIYPQSETPQLTPIAHLDYNPGGDPWAHLMPDRVVWYHSNGDCIVFTVWDYRMNHSVRFSADIDFDTVEYYFKVIATKTAVIVICYEEILVWAIPPLSPHPPDFLNHNPTHVQPLVRIAYPDGIVRRQTESLFFVSQMTSHWYGGSSPPLYFDILCRDSKIHSFEIIVKPDLFDTSLHLINTEFFPHDLDMAFERYSICEDTAVAYVEKHHSGSGQFEVYTRSRSTTAISHGGPAAKLLLRGTASGSNFFLCPASGRYVHFDHDIGGIVVVDLF